MILHTDFPSKFLQLPPKLDTQCCSAVLPAPAGYALVANRAMSWQLQSSLLLKDKRDLKIHSIRTYQQQHNSTVLAGVGLQCYTRDCPEHPHPSRHLEKLQRGEGTGPLKTSWDPVHHVCINLLALRWSSCLLFFVCAVCSTVSWRDKVCTQTVNWHKL